MSDERKIDDVLERVYPYTPGAWEFEYVCKEP